MRNIECNEILTNFIEKLKQIGTYQIKQTEIRKYIIDGKKINIRCTTKEKLWYSVDLNVLPEVDCTIYLTSSPSHNPNYFLMFPSEYLKGILDKMNESKHNNQNLKHFEIDWDGCVLVLKKGILLDVMKYACDLDNPKNYPDFKNCSCHSSKS